jgi:hypothetical protein
MRATGDRTDAAATRPNVIAMMWLGCRCLWRLMWWMAQSACKPPPVAAVEVEARHQYATSPSYQVRFGSTMPSDGATRRPGEHAQHSRCDAMSVGGCDSGARPSDEAADGLGPADRVDYRLALMKFSGSS